MKPTSQTYSEKTVFDIKRIHTDEIIRLEKQIRILDYFIAGCVGASITLACVITHMMITGPSWTW